MLPLHISNRHRTAGSRCWALTRVNANETLTSKPEPHRSVALDTPIVLSMTHEDSTQTPVTAECNGHAGDIRDPRMLYAKGILFLVLGTSAASLLILDSPQTRTMVLLAVCIWAFARAYYFAFYVIEHYVDTGYRFRGLFDFVRYVVKSRRK